MLYTFKRYKRCCHVMISISIANNKLKIILVSMTQGGGFEKLQFDKAPSICSTVPMEAVAFKAEQPVVHSKELGNSFTQRRNPGN